MWKQIGLIVIILALAFQPRGEAQTPQDESYHTPPGVIFESLPSSDATLCVINLRDAEPQWFLLNSTGNTPLGALSAAFGYVNTIKASPDGRYLAVISVGEGHPMLEIIELSKLIQQRAYLVVQHIDPYPGVISLEAWEGLQVHVRSNMLLTRLDKSTGRVPDSMVLGWEETFALSVLTGEITGISEGAKNPAAHYASVLLDENASEAQKDAALTQLLNAHSGELAVTELINVLEHEHDPKRINKILDEISKLQGATKN